MALFIIQSFNNTFVHPFAMDRWVSSTGWAWARTALPALGVAPGVPCVFISGELSSFELWLCVYLLSPASGRVSRQVADDATRCLDTWSFGWNFCQKNPIAKTEAFD